jgi:hypothetical protein
MDVVCGYVGIAVVIHAAVATAAPLPSPQSLSSSLASSSQSAVVAAAATSSLSSSPSSSSSLLSVIA